MKKVIIILSAIMAAAAIFYGIRYINKPLNTVDAVLQTREEKVTAPAYIVRDETIYTAPSSGTVYRNVSDGSRVANNTVISTIYYSSADADTLQELSAVDKKIAEASTSSTSTSSASSSSESAESRIEDAKNDIIDAGMDNDFKTVRQLKNTIKRIRGIEISDNETDSLEDLERQKEEIERQLGGKTEITSTRSGVYTIFFDGMESILSPENAESYTPEDFRNIELADTAQASDTVSEGDNVAKIVNNHVWYVMALVDMAEMGDADVGDDVTLRFDTIPGETVDAEITHISEQEGTQAVIILESTQYLEGAYSIRAGNVDIILSSQTGYIVPSQAITEQDGVQGVWAEKNNVKEFYPAEVLIRYYDTDEYLIQSPEDADKQLSDADKIYTERK